MSIAEFPVVIVGSGFFGSTVAYELATRHDCPVLVLEARNHVGGNSHSRIDAGTGIEYHTYGSHIFHTPNREVWEFVNKFTTFNNYRHRVISMYDGHAYTMPINLMTINNFYHRTFTPAEARTFVASEIDRDHIADPQNLEDKAISLIGRPLYEAFVRGYTRKQWETDLRELPPNIITRLPVRFSYNDFYFSDPYEGIPLNGYAAIFDRMLAHERIHIKTKCDYFDIKSEISPQALVVYTGPIDRFYNFDCGRLDWRTLDLELERIPTGDYQGASVVNYPDPDVPYTRVHEFRHFHPERRYDDHQTLIMREYSRSARAGDEVYYPVNTERNRTLFDIYWGRASQEPRVVFGGRLGTYRYLDMHQAIGAALKAIPQEILPRIALQT